jgi:hypothetical protein
MGYEVLTYDGSLCDCQREASYVVGGNLLYSAASEIGFMLYLTLFKIIHFSYSKVVHSIDSNYYTIIKRQ